GPSLYNPVVNPTRAIERQHYVLRRMRDLGIITDAQLEAAKQERLTVKHVVASFPVHADYVAEMARQMVYDRFKEDSYTRGYKVITTITKVDQEAAYAALRRAVVEYDRRQGYRGVERYVDLSKIK